MKKNITKKHYLLSSEFNNSDIFIPLFPQKNPFHFKIDQNHIYTLMIDKVLSIGPYAFIIGWHSVPLDYQVFYHKKLYTHKTEYIERKDVNSYLGIDQSQKKGFILAIRNIFEQKDNLILKISHPHFNNEKFFQLKWHSIPEDLKSLEPLLGNFLDLLRNDLVKSPEDWKETIKENPSLFLWLAEEALIASSISKIETNNIFSNPSKHEIDDWNAFIDIFDGNNIAGWVKKKSSDASQFIDIYINGTCILEDVNANIYREDLLHENIGNGCYGFNINIENVLYEPGEIIEVKLYKSKSEQVITSKYFDPKNFKPRYKLVIDTNDGNIIQGWCVNKTKSWEVLSLDLYIDEIFYKTIRTDRSRGDLKSKKISTGLGGFYTVSPLKFMRSGIHTISLRFPDGTFSDKYIFKKPLKNIIDSIQYDLINKNNISIIVPIYNAANDVEFCIKNLIKYTAHNIKIILIDDCSSDPRIKTILSKYEKHNQISILHNEINIGFTRTVNRGIVEAGKANVILLNSDARVTPGWIEGILVAAASAPRIATVTPLSDRAGAFSAPEMGNDNILPPGTDEATFAISFRRQSLGLYPRVPTGNGFCMYINRCCIDDIGFLDSDAFPRGYGEENDFCMRALRAGWRNIIDDRTYIFHERSKSFGSSKDSLIKAGRAIVDARYPEYKNAISIFSTDDKIIMARYCARQAWRDCEQKKISLPRILFVISTKTGGTPQTNFDLMSALQGSMESYVLSCDSKELELNKMKNDKLYLVYHHTLEDTVDPISHYSPEYDSVVATWLFDLDIDIVHIRHLAWHSLSLPYLAQRLGKKVVCSFHDFYALTPTVNMLDDKSVFGGNTFLSSSASKRESLWPVGSHPDPMGNWLEQWRKKFQQTLKSCDAFVTTSINTRKLISEGLPELPFHRFFVIPHGRDFPHFYQLRNIPEHGKPLRFLVPGNINRAKGLNVILALAEHDKAGLLEFHILGKIQKTEIPIPSNIIMHGTYERNDFAQKAKKIQPHFGIIFSIWDETYCHTLTELWSIGLPVFVFNFTTIANRIRKSGAGWIVEHQNISLLYKDILRIAFDTEAQNNVDTALKEWQSGYGIANTTRFMATQYFEIYSALLRGEEARTDSSTQIRIGVVCPCEADLHVANASTFIRIWERTRNKVKRNISYIRMTPQSLLACIREGMINGAIIQRTAIPLTMVDELLQAFSHTDTPYLFDIDDDLLNVPEGKDPKGFYAQYAIALHHLIQKASLLTVSTPQLEQLYRKINKNIKLLPNLLSDRLWAPPLPRLKDGIIRALYMGTNTHDEDLSMIFPALDEIAAIEPTFHLALIGIEAKDFLNSERKRWLEIIPIPDHAKNYENFVPWLQSISNQFDFALAPLKDTSFNRCKSYLKILDYMALGLPVVASNIPTYVNLAAPNVKLTGNLPIQWKEALIEEIKRERERERERKKKGIHGYLSII